MLKQRLLNPFLLVVLAFVLVMNVGGVLLMQPWATQTQQSTAMIDAFFTAASALFVTGLTVVETGAYWSFAGQVVILALVQIGALGVVTIGGYLIYLFGQRFYYQDRQMLSESLGVSNKSEVVGILRRVVRYVIIVELLGAVLLGLNFYLHGHPVLSAIWLGIFHAVSAFANAGFDVFGQGNSAASLLEVGVAIEIIMALIIVGGLGFPVWMDLRRKLTNRAHHLSLHSKMVLFINLLLVCSGAVVFFYLEFTARNASVDLWTHGRQSPP